MPGNNSIQILRGNNVKSSSASSEVLLAGQPLYDLSTGYLYVGDGEANIRTIQAINARYANNAGTASSSSYATYSGRVSSNLVINSGASSVNYIGNVSRTIYAPTSLGTSGQVWGMVSSTRAGWVNQTEIPGTIENANHANTANTANHANTANTADTANTANTANKVSNSLRFNGAHANGIAYDVAWNGTDSDTIYVPTAIGNSGQVWGMKNSTHAGWIDQEEVPGTVENANYANYAGTLTAGDKTIDGNLTVVSDIKVLGGIRINGSKIQGGPQPIYINSEANHSCISLTDSSISISSSNDINIFSNSSGKLVNISGYAVNVEGGTYVNLNSGYWMNIMAGSTLELTSPNIKFSTMPTVNGTAINDRANVAGRVDSNLYFAGSRMDVSGSMVNYNVAWNGDLPDTIYVPTELGYANQVWGISGVSQAGWINSPGLTYQGFIDSNSYSIDGKRVLAVCTFGSGEAFIRRGVTKEVEGIRGPVVSIDATRGTDSSVIYTASNGAPSHATFNGRFAYLNAPGGTRWSIFTYSST